MFAKQMFLSISQPYGFFFQVLLRAKGKPLEGNPSPLLGRPLAFLVNQEQGRPVLERWTDFLSPEV